MEQNELTLKSVVYQGITERMNGMGYGGILIFLGQN